MPEKKILIVDADVASRNFIARNLSAQKYEVIQAGSGKEGLIHAWRDHPDLLIVDPTVTDLKGEEMALKLRRDARTSNLPLIALSSDQSVIRIKACLEAGFNEYITKSGQALPTLTEAINRMLGVTAAAAKQGGLLMVCLSAKGGVGVSSLCANLAMNTLLNQPEASVAVVDLVLPIGSIAPIVGYAGAQNIITVADMDPIETSSEFFRDKLPSVGDWKFHLLAGSPDPESSNHLRVGRIWDLINGLKSAYDYVFVDVGHSISKVTMPLIQHADLVTLIISTDLSAVTITKTLWEYLKNKGVKETSVYTILNRAVGLEGLSKAEAEKMLGVSIQTAVPYLGNTFSLANNMHQPFSLKFPRDTASIVFKDAAKEMCTLAKKVRAS